MPDTTERHEADQPRSRWQRLGWFVLLYLAGLTAMVIVAYGLKAVIPGL